MSTQRGRSAVAPADRSIHPNVPGVPWWIALLIATTATAIGYGIDAGHKELTHVFAGLYIAGCVAAVLAVRQSGVFTAVIQPPLILFCAVPGAYWLFHGGKVGNVKDLLINCGYPLIERFPLMLGTAGGVLLIGLVRWFFGGSQRATVASKAANDPAAATTSEAEPFLGGIAAKLNSMLGFASRHQDDRAEAAAATDSPRVHAAAAPPKPARAARGSRSAARTARSGSRHARPPLEGQHEPPVERPRRRRQSPPRDFDPADPPRRPRRRPRPEADLDFRAPAPREMRQEPRTRRSPYERPTRGGRFEPPDRYEPGAPEHFKPYEAYEPHEPYEQPRRRAAPNGSNGANPTHHPISRVRYRGAAPRDEHRDEPHAERRSRPRAPGGSQGPPPAESWEYDG